MSSPGLFISSFATCGGGENSAVVGGWIPCRKGLRWRAATPESHCMKFGGERKKRQEELKRLQAFLVGWLVGWFGGSGAEKYV